MTDSGGDKAPPKAKTEASAQLLDSLVESLRELSNALDELEAACRQITPVDSK